MIPPALILFIDWVLLDCARRQPSGKNPHEPMAGIWMARGVSPKGRGKAGARRAFKLRLSDLPLRRYVAILALRQIGITLDDACWEVALRLGKTTLAQESSIKTAFLKFHSPYPPDQLLKTWRGLFDGFRSWVIQSEDRNINFLADRLAADPDRGPDVAKRFGCGYF